MKGVLIMAKWILDHITKENGKWFAEVKSEDITKREHTGNIWGWEGMNYNSLCVILKEYYNISLPSIKDLKILKKTSSRITYIL